MMIRFISFFVGILLSIQLAESKNLDCQKLINDTTHAERTTHVCESGNAVQCLSAERAERVHMINALSKCGDKLTDEDKRLFKSLIADIDKEIDLLEKALVFRSSGESHSFSSELDPCAISSRKVDAEVAKLKKYCGRGDQCYSAHRNVSFVAEETLKQCHKRYTKKEEERILGIMRRSYNFMNNYNSRSYTGQGGSDHTGGSQQIRQFCPPGTYSNGNTCITIAPATPTCAGTIMAGQSCRY